MKFLQLFIIFIIFILSTGCTTKTELYVSEVKRSGVNMIVMENEAKVTYLKSPDNIERFCASRGVDSSKTSEQGMSLGASIVGKDERVGEESGTGAVALGGRSPAVLITRELMFRACELSMNLNTSKKDTVEIYKMFLNSINVIVKSEHDSGSNAIVAEPVVNKASNFQLLSEKKSNALVDDSDDSSDDDDSDNDSDDDNDDSSNDNDSDNDDSDDDNDDDSGDDN